MPMEDTYGIQSRIGSIIVVERWYCCRGSPVFSDRNIQISYRGRKRLRYVLFEAALSLVARNPEFRKIYEYYRTRENHPLKKMQSLVAVACKVIRVFYVMLTKGVDYDPEKMMRDIRRPELQAA